MQASKTIIILGSKGALGRAVQESFKSGQWKRILCDVGDVPRDGELRIELPRNSPKAQLVAIENGLMQFSIAANSVDAIMNMSGGFSMDTAKSDNLFDSLEQMYSSSIESSVLSARVASQFLSPGGLLILPGSASALGPTPWALSYGAMKSGVHHMVRSLGAPNSGLPARSVVVGIAPVMLDTEANRRSMPDGDLRSWTPLVDVSSRLLQWASDPLSRPPTGTIQKVVTKDGITDFIQV